MSGEEENGDSAASIATLSDGQDNLEALNNNFDIGNGEELSESQTADINTEIITIADDTTVAENQKETKHSPTSQSGSTKDCPTNKSNQTKDCPTSQSDPTKDCPTSQSDSTKDCPTSQSMPTKDFPASQSEEKQVDSSFIQPKQEMVEPVNPGGHAELVEGGLKRKIAPCDPGEEDEQVKRLKEELTDDDREVINTLGADPSIVRVRGLPWSAKEEDLVAFMRGVNISSKHFTYNRDGRASGEAYLVLVSKGDVDKAIAKDKQNLMGRYVEVFKSTKQELMHVLSQQKRRDPLLGKVVKLRGLPFNCSQEEIRQFFDGMDISEYGLVLGFDENMGRPTGEAFVQFRTRQSTEKALGKNMQNIGHRYIEVFRSTVDEMDSYRNPEDLNAVRRLRGEGPLSLFELPPMGPERFVPRGGPAWGGGPRGPGPGPGFAGRGGPPRGGFNGGRGRAGRWGGYGGGRGRGGGGGGGGGGPPQWAMPGYDGPPVDNNWDPFSAEGSQGPVESGTRFVHIRGLPFRATEDDIYEFFQGMTVINIDFLFTADGRATGECDVEFETSEDAKLACKKDREHIGHRYVEVWMGRKAPAGGKRMAGSSAGAGRGGKKPMNQKKPDWASDELSNFDAWGNTSSQPYGPTPPTGFPPNNKGQPDPTQSGWGPEGGGWGGPQSQQQYQDYWNYWNQYYSYWQQQQQGSDIAPQNIPTPHNPPPPSSNFGQMPSNVQQPQTSYYAAPQGPSGPKGPRGPKGPPQYAVPLHNSSVSGYGSYAARR